MKIYIAGKIGGLPEQVYTTLFKNAETILSHLGFNPINPVELPHEHSRTWKEYMKEDVKALKECDAVYMLNNWTESRGAKIEHRIAIMNNKHIIYQRGNLS